MQQISWQHVHFVALIDPFKLLWLSSTLSLALTKSVVRRFSPLANSAKCMWLRYAESLVKIAFYKWIEQMVLCYPNDYAPATSFGTPPSTFSPYKLVRAARRMRTWETTLAHSIFHFLSGLAQLSLVLVDFIPCITHPNLEFSTSIQTFLCHVLPGQYCRSNFSVGHLLYSRINTKARTNKMILVHIGSLPENQKGPEKKFSSPSKSEHLPKMWFSKGESCGLFPQQHVKLYLRLDLSVVIHSDHPCVRSPRLQI